MKQVTIIHNLDWNEYRVPGLTNRKAEIYYTDDRQDAIDTAKAVHGQDVKIKIRNEQEN